MSDTPIIDFHIHPGPRWLPTERRLHQNPQIKQNIQMAIDAMDDAGIHKGVLLIMDEDWFRSEAGDMLLKEVGSAEFKDRVRLCAMFDVFRLFEEEESIQLVQKAIKMGVRGIKIHPNIQRITKSDFPQLIKLAQAVSELNAFIVVHAFSDQVNCFDNFGLEIVSYLAPHVKSHLVIAHSGGIDFSRAVFLALQYPHIMLDLSYLLELEDKIDVTEMLRWGINALGAHRFLFGTDHPSCSAKLYKERYSQIFDKIRLSENEKALIFGINAQKIIY